MPKPALCRCDETCNDQNVLDNRCCGWFQSAEAQAGGETPIFDPWENAPSQVEVVKPDLDMP